MAEAYPRINPRAMQMGRNGLRHLSATRQDGGKAGGGAEASGSVSSAYLYYTRDPEGTANIRSGRRSEAETALPLRARRG
ncbi:MAG: hypothetical protein FJW30_11505 [Acidobacteria bacterium]|nr:hypothetical protein [Acidobacteriota bacterium]